jgi:heparin/heparan-sulfate lyase
MDVSACARSIKFESLQNLTNSLMRRIIARNILLFCSSVLVAFLACSLELRAAPPGPATVPPKGHPRLLIQAGDLIDLKSSQREAAMASEWAELRRRAALPPGYRPAARYDGVLVQAAEANAFLSLVQGDRAAARRAIEIVFRYLDESLPFPRRSDDTRVIGRALFVMAEVYDWCFNALAEGEKRQLIAAVPQNGRRMEIGFPPLEQSDIVGHAGEAQLFRDLLAVGIAMFDEEPSYYEMAADRIYNRLAPSRNFTYAGHFHHQGAAYGTYRFTWECWATLLLTRMGAPAPFNLSDMSEVPYWLFYLRQPDGAFFQDGDGYMGRRYAAGAYWTHPQNLWGLITGLFHDPQFAAEWRRMRAYVEPAADALEEPILNLVMRPDRIVPATRETLPLARYFPEPFGAILARTGWDIGTESRNAAAYLKIGTHQFGNHQHADSGQFQLYYRGQLAIDSGIYQSNDTTYGSDHFLNYYQRSVAHNTLLIDEPTETSHFLKKTVTNDGGQRYLVGNEDAFTTEEFWAQDRRFARVLAHYIGPDPSRPSVSLIKGDLTPAYVHTKAAQVMRTMVFLPLDQARGPAAALVVLDRVESVSPAQKKIFLLHSQEEPEVKGVITTIRRHGVQTEIQRMNPVAITTAKDSNPRYNLEFDLRTLAGAKPLKAELVICAKGGRKAGEIFRIMADDGVSVELTPLRGSPAASADITEKLKTAVAAGKERQVFAVEGPALALEMGDPFTAPYLRVWVEAEPYAGKLVQTTLLPLVEHAVIEKIGGPGREFWSAGRNWPATPPFANKESRGWRVEVSDKSAGKVARFLHVEQVMDPETKPVETRLVTGNGFIGAAMGGYLLLASENGKWIEGGFTFVVTGTDVAAGGLATVIITDLPAGDCAVWRADTLVELAAVAGSAHTLVFRLPPGNYRIEQRR